MELLKEKMMKTTKSLLRVVKGLLAASTVSLCLAPVASAGAIFTQGSAAPAGMEVIRFPVTGTITGPDDFVTGVVGAGPVATLPVIEFTSSTDQLYTTDSGAGAGFRGISSPDDDRIQNFVAQLADGVFTSFFFNAFAQTIPRNPPGRFATVTVYEADGGQSVYTQALTNNSNTNRLLITATGGDLFTRVEFSTSASIESIRQLRIDGVQPSPVPEPSALWIFAAGLLGITLVRRARRA